MPHFRYMSDGELLDPVVASSEANIPISGVGNPVGMSSGHLADSPHRSYYIWKEPPRQQQQQQQGPPQGMFFVILLHPKNKQPFSPPTSIKVIIFITYILYLNLSLVIKSKFFCPGYEQYAMDHGSPVRHPTYASQVNFYLQHQSQPPVSFAFWEIIKF